MIGSFALAPQIVDAVPQVPIVAAGAIMDGRGLVAALALGASDEYISKDDLVKDDDSSMNKRVIKPKQTSLSDFI